MKYSSASSSLQSILSFVILISGNVAFSQLTDPPSNCDFCPPKSNCVAQEANAPGARLKPIGWMKCECKDGYLDERAGWVCTPINECVLDEPVCPENAYCVDKDPLDTEFPKYECGCNPPYVALSENEQGATHCGMPGDTTPPTPLPTNTAQLPTPPPPTESPTENPLGSCNGLCPPVANCVPYPTDIPFFFAPKFQYNGIDVTCECKPGTTGDGWRCNAVNECLLPSTCNFQGGICIDRNPNDGGYKCECEDGYDERTSDGNGATSCLLITSAPSVSHAPSTTQAPTLSLKPTPSPTRRPTRPITPKPTPNTPPPTKPQPTKAPSLSFKPSAKPSNLEPTVSNSPSTSDAPSVSIPSASPSLSIVPSDTPKPSGMPSISDYPSVTIFPSLFPTK